MKSCQICRGAIPATIVIEGVRRWLHSRKLCLQCSPWGEHNTVPASRYERQHEGVRKCIVCKDVKDLECFTPIAKNRRSSRCRPCEAARVISLHRAVKDQAVQYKGGACAICGYSRYVGSLDFHHLDPSQKDFNISSNRYKFSTELKLELDKCVLLCRNCHAEVHGGVVTLERLELPTTSV